MSTLYAASTATGIRYGHAWTDGEGRPHATVKFAAPGVWPYVELESVADADALITAATEARDALLRLEAEAAAVPLPGDDSTEAPAHEPGASITELGWDNLGHGGGE